MFIINLFAVFLTALVLVSEGRVYVPFHHHHRHRPMFSNKKEPETPYKPPVSILDPEDLERWQEMMAQLYNDSGNYTKLGRGPSYRPRSKLAYHKVNTWLPYGKPKGKRFSSNGFGLGKNIFSGFQWWAHSIQGKFNLCRSWERIRSWIWKSSTLKTPRDTRIPKSTT